MIKDYLIEKDEFPYCIRYRKSDNVYFAISEIKIDTTKKIRCDGHDCFELTCSMSGNIDAAKEYLKTYSKNIVDRLLKLE